MRKGTVMSSEVAGERVLQHGDLGPHAAPGQLGQHLRVPLPGGQRASMPGRRPSGDPEDIGDDNAELNAGFSELRMIKVLTGQTVFEGCRRDGWPTW